MSKHYSIDIYRTEDAILIHDKPGGWKRTIPALLLCLGGAFIIVVLGIVPLLMEPLEENHAIVAVIFCFVFIPVVSFMLFCTLWRIDGHDTILIDRDSIRNDWWFFLWSRSLVYPRPETILTDTLPNVNGLNFFLGGAFGAHFRIGKRWWQVYNMYLPSAAERDWLFDEIARFQQEVPATQPIDEGRPVQKGSLHDSEFGKNVLQSLDWKGKKFQLVIPSSES